MVEFKASHRFARMSARKVRLVMNEIRGMPVGRAIDSLRFNTRRGAFLIRKVVESALANAEHRIQEHDLAANTDHLVVAEGRVDEGPSFSRWRARSRGMANPIIKRTCHIHVTLREAAN